MKTGIKVGDIMTRSFVAVKPETNLINCAKEMMKKRVGSLILKDGQRLLGLLTEKDIIWAITKKQKLSKIQARDIASRKVATIKPSADVAEAMERMKKLKFRRLPVIVNGNVVGMLTLKDILRIQPDLYSNMQDIEKIKEESEKLRRMKSSFTKEGRCEECGNFDILYKTDSRLICDDCREAM